MRFVVPQFIDIEDKIIGPLSVRQFIIFLIVFGLIFLLFKLLSFISFLIFGTLVFGLGGVFAFAKINGQSFHYFLLNIIYTLRRPKLKVWKREPALEETKEAHRRRTIKTAKVVSPKKTVTSSRLAQLTLVVDTGGAYKEEEEVEIK